MTIVLDLFSVCVAFTLAASRVLMTLARDALLPRALSRTSDRFHTPIGGLAVIAAWAVIVIGWAALSRYGHAAHIPDVLPAVLILSATGYLITFVYLLPAVGVGVYFAAASVLVVGVWYLVLRAWKPAAVRGAGRHGEDQPMGPGPLAARVGS